MTTDEAIKLLMDMDAQIVHGKHTFKEIAEAFTLEKRQVDELVEQLEKERAAIARYLVPHRREMPQCWLQHFRDRCGVYFDAVGFVHPRPVVLQCVQRNHTRPEEEKPDPNVKVPDYPYQTEGYDPARAERLNKK